MADNVARSVIDVILGEAGGRTRAERYADMLAIASTIQNRADVGKVTRENVVSNAKEFNAYGKALPAGVESHRDLAKQALNQVLTQGPVHAGTYYATPAAKDGLPNGLKELTRTENGHVFFSDPQNRSFRTELGFVTPSLLNTVSTPPVPTPAPRGPEAQNMFGLPSISQAAQALGALANGLTPERSGPRGMEALAPNGLLSPALDFYNAGQSGIVPALSNVLTGVSRELGGKTLGITSGYRSPERNAAVGGAARSQHMAGKAVDIDMKGMSIPEREALVTELSQRAVGGIGAYTRYPDMLHVDMRARPNRETPHFMFDKTKDLMSRAPGWFQDMAASKGIKMPGTTTAIPTQSPNAAAARAAGGYQQMAASLAAGGVRGIGGNPPAPPSPSRPDNQAYQGPSFTSPARPDNAAYSGPRGNFSVPNAPAAAAPSPARPDNLAYGGPRGLQPADVNATVSPARPDNAIYSGPRGLGGPGGIMMGLPAAVAPQSLPNAPARTVTAAPPMSAPRSIGNLPVASVPQAPQHATLAPPSIAAPGRDAAAAERAPSYSGMPSGMNAIGALFSSPAGALARSATQPGISFQSMGGGRVNMTNAHGVTRAVTDWQMPTDRQISRGTQTGQRSVAASVASTTGRLNTGSPLEGLIGQRQGGILGGLFGTPMDRKAVDFDRGVKGGLGALAGGLIGNALLGQAGAMLGGVAGSRLAKGDALFGTRLSQRDYERAMAQIQFGLPFPAAPAPIGGPQGNPSYSDMADISPAAADAISAGRAGLY